MPDPIEIGLHSDSEVNINDFLSNTTLEQPTMYLKYVNNVLHQKWLITDYENGVIVSQREEWKEIPSENDDT